MDYNKLFMLTTAFGFIYNMFCFVIWSKDDIYNVFMKFCFILLAIANLALVLKHDNIF